MSRLRYIPRAKYPYRSSDGVSKSSRGGLEFAGIRRYVPGDDVRRIAWRASARAPYLLVKECEDEVAFCLKILIDVSRSITEHFPEVSRLREFVKKFWLPARKQGIDVAIHPFASKIYPACLLSELSIADEISNFRFEGISRTLNFDRTMLLIISDFRSEEPGNSLEHLQSLADHCDLIALRLTPYSKSKNSQEAIGSISSEGWRNNRSINTLQKLIIPHNLRYSSFSAEHRCNILYQEFTQTVNFHFLLESPCELAVQALANFFNRRKRGESKK